MVAQVNNSDNALASVISTAVQIPGVKISRETFLMEQFKNESIEMQQKILAEGPVAANCSRLQLRKMARRIINERTVISSGVSVLAGLPGGIAMAATIPADMVQFYAFSLRMAQELAYLYGEEDLWCDGTLDADKVLNQLVLYCGVMLGASGAAQAVRAVSSSLAKRIATELPKKHLTKKLYFQITKKIVKFLTGKVLIKDVFSKNVAKAVPVVGGVVAGGITFFSMRPMGMRLADTLETAHFSYTKDDYEADIEDIVEICEEPEDDVREE